VSPLEHVPQLATLRGFAQVSMPLRGPHVVPSRAQNAASVSAVQVHLPLLQAN
jgi:hypothetical protein